MPSGKRINSAYPKPVAGRLHAIYLDANYHVLMTDAKASIVQWIQPSSTYQRSHDRNAPPTGDLKRRNLFMRQFYSHSVQSILPLGQQKQKINSANQTTGSASRHPTRKPVELFVLIRAITIGPSENSPRSVRRVKSRRYPPAEVIMFARSRMHATAVAAFSGPIISQAS